MFLSVRIRESKKRREGERRAREMMGEERRGQKKRGEKRKLNRRGLGGRKEKNMLSDELKNSYRYVEKCDLLHSMYHYFPSIFAYCIYFKWIVFFPLPIPPKQDNHHYKFRLIL
jgi:hypothetical protein